MTAERTVTPDNIISRLELTLHDINPDSLYHQIECFAIPKASHQKSRKKQLRSYILALWWILLLSKTHHTMRFNNTFSSLNGRRHLFLICASLSI